MEYSEEFCMLLVNYAHFILHVSISVYNALAMYCLYLENSSEIFLFEQINAALFTVHKQLKKIKTWKRDKGEETPTSAACLSQTSRSFLALSNH